MTPSAGYVFQGRDNTGAAAIVNSEQDTTFIDGMINKLAADKLRLEKKKEDDTKAFREEMGELDFDPTGVQDLDNENEALVVAAEDYAVEQLQLGKNPLDPTTPEGKEFIAKKRAAQRNSAVGKGATNQFNLAVKAANADGVDKGHAKEWIAGYKAVKPNEGESNAQAKARYVSENPYEPQKMVGMYDFVADIIPNLSRTKNGRVSELDKDNAMVLLNTKLLSDEGKMIAKSEMRQQDLDYGNPDDVQKYLEGKYKLIEARYPKQVGTPPRSSSSSSSGGGRNSDKATYQITYSEDKSMLQDGNDNAIRLANKSGGSLPLMPITSTINGIPISINKASDGKLYLEYQVEKKDSVLGDKLVAEYIPYDKVRDMIKNLYNDEDIAEVLLNGGGEDASEAPKAGKKAESANSQEGEWEIRMIGGKPVKFRKKQ
jgi:hypothetical protein